MSAAFLACVACRHRGVVMPIRETSPRSTGIPSYSPTSRRPTVRMRERSYEARATIQNAGILEGIRPQPKSRHACAGGAVLGGRVALRNVNRMLSIISKRIRPLRHLQIGRTNGQRCTRVRIPNHFSMIILDRVQEEVATVATCINDSCLTHLYGNTDAS